MNCFKICIRTINLYSLWGKMVHKRDNILCKPIVLFSLYLYISDWAHLKAPQTKFSGYLYQPSVIFKFLFGNHDFEIVKLNYQASLYSC